MSRPLDILHLTTFYPPYSFGGDAMYLYRLCHALADAGHHVDVAHCVDSFHLLHPAPPGIRFTEHPGVRRHELRSAFGPLSPILTQQTGRPWLKRDALQKLLDSRPYDLIHYHNMSLIGPAGMRMKPRFGNPIKLYTTHEHWLVCPMHVLWKFNSRPCEKPECLQCVLRGKRPPQLWRYTNLLEDCASHVDRFVSPSRFTARMHAERGFSRPVGHLPYFIDRADADWQQPGPPPHDRPYFICVGRLERIKGFDGLIRLWREIDFADLLVVGSGNDESELRQAAAGSPRIRFVGALPQRELGRFYRHALACVVPSTTYETFGIIILEAFARKTPVIVRDLGALPEVATDSKGGLVFRSDGELLGHLRRIASEPATRQRLGENGYAAFLRWWTREAHMKLYFGLLEEIAIGKFGAVPWEEAPRVAAFPKTGS
jgi:glycosyltransferase involved in cell wall biosynthesis